MGEQETTHTRRLIVGTAVCLALVMMAAWIGASYRPGSWYQALAKPSWTPPDSVFGPVWTLLYVMIALAGGLVFATHNRAALLMWGAGLVLNALWSRLFFGDHQIGAALLDIGLLWLSIGAFIVLAWPTSRLAAALFIPYWAWVTYAGVLNFAIWRLNP